IARLAFSPVHVRRRLPWLPILLSAAAGFLLAVLVFRPWERGADRIVRDQRTVPEPQVKQQPLADGHETERILLAVANEAVEFLAPGQQGWQTLKAGGQIPVQSRVRTGTEARCEFRLADG